MALKKYIMTTKRQIITKINALDASRNKFDNGRYVNSVKFYYGNLNKYTKSKLLAIYKNMLKNTNYNK